MAGIPPVLTVQVDWSSIKYLNGEIDHLPLSTIAMMRFALEAEQAVEEHFRECEECDDELPCEAGEHLYGLANHLRHLAIRMTEGEDMSLLIEKVIEWSQLAHIQAASRHGLLVEPERGMYDLARQASKILRGEK